MKQLCLVLLLVLSFASEAQDSQYILVRRIDALIDAYQKEQGVDPNEIISEDVFVRRVYLDIVGRIPSLNELKSYRMDLRPNKRTLLIDKLIKSKAQLSHSFNYWADVLRFKDKMRRGSGENYKDFIKKSLLENKPYNKFVNELLKADGPAYEYGNGATGYYLRDAGMPLDNLSMTMQVFLGTSMVCAQCHDHPFNDWTQLDFYKVAGFNSGINTRSHLAKNTTFKGTDIKEKQKDNQFKKTYRNLNDILSIGIRHNGTGKIRLPHDYNYDDAKPNEMIKAEVPYGMEIPLDFSHPPVAKSSKSKKKSSKSRKQKKSPLVDINSRGAFADWLTSEDNPLFTKVIVNRMWNRVMGTSLVGELDDLEQSDEGLYPELTQELERQMKLLNYDLQEFMSILYKTKLYQREVVKTDLAYRQDYHFEGPMLKRASSEQLWDSFLSLATDDPDKSIKIHFPMNQGNLLYKEIHDKSGLELIELIDSVKEKNGLKNFTKSLSSGNMASMPSMGSMMEQKEDGVDVLKAKVKKLASAMKLAQKKKDKNAAQKYKAEIKKLSVKIRNQQKGKSRKGPSRASELRSPESANHFLRRFGQSEREEHDAASTESSIPQALSLLNGKVEDFLILNKNSVINKNLANANNASDKIKVAYQSILSREPQKHEKELFELLFASDAEAAQKDLIWVLVNSHEFKFIK